MKRYNITVNGKTYSVDVEEVDLKKQHKPKIQHSDLQSEIEPIEISSSAIEIDVKETVKSPLAGVVAELNKHVGDRVSYGETLLIISSDDMSNDIGAPKDGVVTEVLVGAGDTVEVDTVMMIIN